MIEFIKFCIGISLGIGAFLLLYHVIAGVLTKLFFNQKDSWK